ncbi:marine proteobacterial sortase target protein [Pseudothauera rhizosphaerae]|nr:marine proteobacterial sortase target protein [Pseudothauera rhizosphaerae]
MNTTTARDAAPASGRQHIAEIAALVLRILAGGLLVALVQVVLVLLLTSRAYAVEMQATPMKVSEAGQGTLLMRADDGSTHALPTLATDVTIRVNGPLARARVVQTFRNPGTDWLEGIYVFPLPDNAAVDRLRMQVGERVVEGEIHEKEQARAQFEQARKEGKRAALVEQERPNIFTTSVANIAPGAEIRVEIEYQQTLDYQIVDDAGRYSLRFPMVVGPRYIPGAPDGERSAGHGTVPPTNQVPDAHRITPPVLHPDKGLINPVSLRVELDAGVPLASVDSPYHAVRIDTPHAHRRVVELAAGTAPANRDFELVWTLAAGQAPQVALFTESGRNVDYALLMMVPPRLKADESPLPREVIFILDTSGSMDGTSIVQAREALALALRRLNPADHFNVIEFNSQANALFPAAQPATRNHVELAARWVRSLQARGGTEMRQALAMALDGAEDPTRVRQVIFLTDGAVGNEEALFRLIEQRLGDSRLFTVGIGSAPNSHFMRKAASAGRGTFTYIGKLEEVQERMSALFAKLESPVLKGIELAWPDGSAAEAWPRRVPDLYAGEPLVVAAALKKTGGTLRVTGWGRDVQWQADVPLAEASPAAGIGVLWARQKIDSLLDGLRGGAQEAEVRPAVVELALQHHLVSRYTSLVAVDKTPVRPAAEALKGGAMPTNLPEGWKYESVFGQLPKGATGARMNLLLGCLALFAGAALWLIQRRSRAAFTLPA